MQRLPLAGKSTKEQAILLQGRIDDILSRQKDELSTNKLLILDELKNYLDHVANPAFSRFLSGTDRGRMANVARILENINNIDPIFLLQVLNEALRIECDKSELRDKAGKKALSQLMKYTAGLLELFLLLLAVHSFIHLQFGHGFYFLAFCWIVSSTESIYQSQLEKTRTLPGGMREILLDLIRTSLFQGLYFGLITRSLSLFTDQEISRTPLLTTLRNSTRNVPSNIGNFVGSNFLFFRKLVVVDNPGEQRLLELKP